MIIKKTTSGTFIFQKKSGITAFFSDDEEKILYDYFENLEKNDFINRLFDLKILTSHKKIIKENFDLPLQSIHIDITDSCPLKCKQCYKKSSEDIFMDFEKFKKIIDEAESLNIFQIALGGGEPLIHKDILKFVEYVSKTNMSVSITTSGYNLNEKLILELIKRGINHIQISLNGSKKEIDELSRDGFDYGMSAIKLLNKSKISFGINTVVSQDNINDLQNIFDIGKKYNADNINLLRYKPSGKKLEILMN